MCFKTHQNAFYIQKGWESDFGARKTKSIMADDAALSSAADKNDQNYDMQK